LARERLEDRMGKKRPPVVWKSWAPRRIGPRFDWLDYEHIRLIDGPLSERVFRLSTQFSDEWATVRLFDGDATAGEASIEHDPPGKGIVLWDVGVKEEFRGGGLASIMVWTIFRELLLAQHSATFRIRMIQSHKPGAGGAGPEVQNIGMSVIAARLRFQPELDLTQLTNTDNIKSIEPLPPQDGLPPALKLTLGAEPLVLVGFVLTPDTMKPILDYRTYVQLEHDDYLIGEWVERGLLFISGNYCLREKYAARLADILATDEDEARLFRQRVHGL
jgi:hypothetical protein